MKILCVITCMGPGGAERQICGLASMLARRGHEVRLRWFDGKPFYIDVLDAAGVDYGRLGARSRYFRARMLGASIRIFRPDTVIAFLGGAAEAACSLKRLGGDFRLVVSERNVTQNLSDESRKFAAYRHADAVVCNSYSQADLVRARFPELASKVSVITNFTDLERFSPDTASGREGLRRPFARIGHPKNRDFRGPRTGLSDRSGGQQGDGAFAGTSNPLRIGVVARTAAQKNVPRFIEAAGKVAAAGVDAEFDWYGAAAPWLGSDGPVRFHPPVSDILGVYRSSDALCLPSLYEGFPNAVCEALACGLPVLCSRVCDNPRLVEDGVNGFLFDPLDPEDIAAAIRRFCALSADERLRMGVASRRKAEALLSPETFLASWQEII